MRRLLRRWFRCPKGEHRETLEMLQMRLGGSIPRTVVMHIWYWRCVDCAARRYFADSDNIEEERRAGRIA